MTADPQGRSHPPYRLDALAVFMLSAVEASKAALSRQISEWSINFQSPLVTFGPVGPDRPSRRARVRPPYRVVRGPIRSSPPGGYTQSRAPSGPPDTARN